MANALVESGDFDQAQAAYTEALRAAQTAGDNIRVGLVLQNVGRLLDRMGHLREAEKAYLRAVDALNRAGVTDDRLLVRSWGGLPAVYIQTGQYSKAATLIRRVLADYPGGVDSDKASLMGSLGDDPKGAWTRPNPPRSGIGKFGRYIFAEADARQWAEWEFDYCKYDWKIDSPDRARLMGNALRACGRDVVFELSNDAPLEKAKEFTPIANMCRTTNDIVDVWDRSQLDTEKQKWALGVRDIWNRHKQWREFNRPGHWNMPCPLRVGVLGGWDLKPLQPTRLTLDEQYTHISLWCLWSAPLIIGCPIERLDKFTLSLLTNDEVLDLDQDRLAGRRLNRSGRGRGAGEGIGGRRHGRRPLQSRIQTNDRGPTPLRSWSDRTMEHS